MADTSTTLYMGMVLPVPSLRAGPLWASDLVTALSTRVDAHNHTTGGLNGQQLGTAALRLDTDLSLNSVTTTGLNLTGFRSARFVSQSAALAASTDVACLYVSGNNLFYNNGSAQAVQITSGSTLSATSLGGISGLPSGTASASFGSQTFTWRSATNTAATMDVGPLVIRDTALGALGISVISPTSLASGYSLTLPTAVPASSKLLSLSSAGLMSYADVDNSTLQNVSGTLSLKAVTSKALFPSVGQQFSSSCGAFTTNSTSYVDVTNLTVTLTTTGRPVSLQLQPDTTGTPAFIQEQGTGNQTLQLALLRDGANIGAWKFNVASGTATVIFGSGLAYLDGPTAASHTYKVQALTTPSGIAAVQNYVLVAYEL